MHELGGVLGRSSGEAALASCAHGGVGFPLIQLPLNRLCSVSILLLQVTSVGLLFH